ncbi:N-formylglutamate amidohydrolase [Marinicella meishanensis]|uniref:N-formylglutamate amidohydrolase n=1 Tax=Marinicella meishanensis TaxID=2873263 RepID=UPI001CBEB339|nr:N-formylglutamate amidohydrolase [Marinicella sp. NBU2979]
MPVFELNQVDSPLVISVPHDGALIPDDIKRQMNPSVMGSSDRDLLIDQVFNFAPPVGSKIKALYSRHVIDLNRPDDGAALYADQAETELCPTTTFDWQAIYLPGHEPDAAEIKRRIEAFWRPYHQQLQALIEQAKVRHGFCLLIDAHSIDDTVPRFFTGQLPAINVGTNSGQSCAPALEQALMQRLQAQSDFSVVNNGRFKGGHITRHYGQPEQGVHAIQLEHAKSAYLDAALKWSTQGEQLRQFWQQTLNHLLSVHKIEMS